MTSEQFMEKTIPQIKAKENSTPLSIATDYQRRGWQPLPLPLKYKKPVFTGWQNFKTTEDELPNHFNGK